MATTSKTIEHRVWTGSLANHTLKVEFQYPECEVYRLVPPDGGWCESVQIVFLETRTIITGDLCPRRNGLISDLRYGRHWFSGRLSADYLAEKFLAQRWIDTKCIEELSRYLDDEDYGDMLSDKHHAAIREVIEEIPNIVADRGADAASAEVHEMLYNDVGQWIVDDGIPGVAYDPFEQSLLVAIQQRFSDLWHESFPNGWPVASEAKGGA
jgi:hypothetical protein